MSLDFELGKIADWKTVCAHPTDAKKLHPVTDSLIWRCLACDMSGISKGNVDEFFWRVRLLQRLDGANWHFGVDGTPVYITKQDIIDHIGLTTNVSQKTRTQFLAKIGADEHPPLQQDRTAGEVIHEIYMAVKAKAETEKSNIGDNVLAGG
jgi:hypothetical protein